MQSKSSVVLKDVCCSHCGRTQESMLPGEQRRVALVCMSCRCTRMHESQCTGGIKRRYRYRDWDGVDASGYVEYMGMKAGHPHPDAVDTPHESASATPWADASGSVFHDRPQHCQDGIDERRKKRKSDKRRANGLAPTYFGVTSPKGTAVDG